MLLGRIPGGLDVNDGLIFFEEVIISEGLAQWNRVTLSCRDPGLAQSFNFLRVSVDLVSDLLAHTLDTRTQRQSLQHLGTVSDNLVHDLIEPLAPSLHDWIRLVSITPTPL
jgi:hypothetical protein